MDPDSVTSRQVSLQAEAQAVVAALDLESLLRSAGEPVLVGSAALGLMTWRDLDMTVICDSLDKARVLQLASHLATHSDVRTVQFRNDTGRWNIEPSYPDGLYLGVAYRAVDGEEWKIDLWFVDEPDRQPDLSHLRTVADRLTPETRTAILTIKTAWCSRPEYGTKVRSWDIYTAVLDDGVRTVDDFDSWRSR